ncbi:uncharacterized protein NECHADRAFT_55945 [Fusarium vanettenii 77-13-4]|uniref:Acyl-CoA thioesterase II n=1 Tax=Fusarium vanettenii (strain ATCC MYA-4622 / CBS 123669 / FGSC 9596 / NRRL 45880 / 77-13-4) TaxID=660122 RepID=C7ZQ50_FUSV7|nr:uncharacterized protein NECHADRAFT_55945 [Fusarium vanettenii 77-13-4]EEU33846.1 hypothetical protein NECHADRAFT_55945 [Fusarium vanettenii 77-13-4]
MPSLASTLQQQLAVDEISTGQYVSCLPPEKMANVANIAYGGCTVGVAIAAACQTVKPGYRLYTAMGSYLGPALTDRKLFMHVQSIRDTRTFATRQVLVSQERDGHQERRPCLTALIDFQLAEKESLLTYSAPPAMAYAAPESLLDVEQVDEHLVTSGKASSELASLLATEASLMRRVFHIRPSPEGVMHRNLLGRLKTPTTQEHLTLPERTTGDYFKTKHRLTSLGEQVAGVGFLLDGSLSFTPLAHSSMSLEAAGACSSLDFALRVFTNEVDLNGWNFREIKTVTGGDGRTYSEARLWDKEGRMVADMTQQCILRPNRPNL